MVSTQDKLNVLSQLAAEFNRCNIVWAVGASVLLYLEDYVEDFHDLDILVADTDAGKMEQILHRFGSLQPSDQGNFATKHFRKFTVADVEVDMIGGFAIIKDGQIYDCDLHPSQITGYAEVDGQNIPLHSIPLWRKYYSLMGRDAKVSVIDRKSPASCV